MDHKFDDMIEKRKKDFQIPKDIEDGFADKTMARIEQFEQQKVHMRWTVGISVIALTCIVAFFLWPKPAPVTTPETVTEAEVTETTGSPNELEALLDTLSTEELLVLISEIEGEEALLDIDVNLYASELEAMGISEVATVAS